MNTDVVRMIRGRARTEGLPAAFEAVLQTCKNEKARPAERLDAANLICRMSGIFEGAGEDDSDEKAPSTMTRAELVARAEQARQVLAALDEEADGSSELFG
ncbi:hypothetical protein ASF22_05010 [Methylobacterium sp. Leaf87]|nr:hypothetical protein ASF22_05010 [Methylobacterium sp. Leaf87]